MKLTTKTKEEKKLVKDQKNFKKFCIHIRVFFKADIAVIEHEISSSYYHYYCYYYYVAVAH